MSQHPPGDTAPPPPPPPPPHPDGPRITADRLKDVGRMRRSSDDRKVAGVAAGIARFFDIDPLVVRIAFVVLAFFGGGGILFYVACWLFVPEERTDDAVISVDERSRTVILAIAAVASVAAAVGDSFGGPGFPWPLAAVALAAVALYGVKNRPPRRHPGPLPGVTPTPVATGAPTGAQNGAQAGAPAPQYAGYRPPQRRPRNPRKRGPLLFWFTLALAAVGVGVVMMVDLAGADVSPAAYPATVMGVCGVMLLVGAFYGRAGGLILVGLLAAGVTAASIVADDLDLQDGAGEVHVTPTTAASLDASYEVAVGDIRIDLTELGSSELARLDGRHLYLRANLGEITVIVPEHGLTVDADARTDVGDLTLFDSSAGDLSDSAHHSGGADAPQLSIDADIDLGDITIEKEAA